ncbi:MAG: ORF6N domain-containing protein [Clostridium sp.]
MEAAKVWEEQRQAQLINNGIVEVEGMKFHSIEGGFGEGKKSILAKEVAIIHGKDVGRINEAINRNRKRFTNSVDIIDLKDTEFAIDLCDSGIYTRNSINASSNIYLLSERGYAKLLKILEDDFAWEQYDKLVDGYFNMRAGHKEKPSCIEDVLIQSLKEMKQFREQLNHVNHNALAAKAQAERTKEEIQGIRDVITLDPNSWRDECRKLISKIALSLGGYQHISDINKEIYTLMDTRLGSRLSIRLTNKRRRMADEGICKSKRDKLTYVDVIADDKKLIEGYKAIVKEMAIKYGVT